METKIDFSGIIIKYNLHENNQFFSIIIENVALLVFT